MLTESERRVIMFLVDMHLWNELSEDEKKDTPKPLSKDYGLLFGFSEFCLGERE